MTVSLDHPHGNEWWFIKGHEAATHFTPCPACGVPCRWHYSAEDLQGIHHLTIDYLNAECSTNTQGAAQNG